MVRVLLREDPLAFGVVTTSVFHKLSCRVMEFDGYFQTASILIIKDSSFRSSVPVEWSRPGMQLASWLCPLIPFVPFVVGCWLVTEQR